MVSDKPSSNHPIRELASLWCANWRMCSQTWPAGGLQTIENRSPLPWLLTCSAVSMFRLCLAVSGLCRALEGLAPQSMHRVLCCCAGSSRVAPAAGTEAAGHNWWYRFPDFVPVAALQAGVNPRCLPLKAKSGLSKHFLPSGEGRLLSGDCLNHT